MASTVLTRADSLRSYLTGAASDGGAQTAPNASLGNFRSSTEAGGLGIAIASAIANITIDYASGENAVGAGSLECVDIDSLKWKYLGDSFGATVPIANGESKLFESGSSPGSFLRITRTSATNLVPGTATVTLSSKLNNVFGFDDVSSSEASAGDTEYRGFIVKNVSAGSVTLFKMWLDVLGTQRTSDTTQLGASGSGTIVTTGSFADWPESGFCRIQQSGGTLREIVYYTSRTNTTLTVPSAGRGLLGTSAGAGASDDTLNAVPGIAIGKDTAGVQAAGSSIQTIANESTAPSTVTYSTGITAAGGLSIGTMTTGQLIGIWIKRQYPAGAKGLPVADIKIKTSFDV